MQSEQEGIITSWITWHYSTMPALLLEIWKSYLIFCAEFFSIPLLLVTLLSPWRHEVMPKKKGFDMAAFFSGLIYNSYSRLMGAAVRLAIIGLGIVSLIAAFFAGLLAIAVFLMLPLLVPILLFFFFYV